MKSLMQDAMMGVIDTNGNREINFWEIQAYNGEFQIISIISGFFHN